MSVSEESSSTAAGQPSSASPGGGVQEISESSSEASQAFTRTRHFRSLVWLLIHAIVYIPCRVWCRTRVIGRENLRADCGGILLVNHQSYLDPLLVGVRLSRAVSYLARDSLFRVPCLGWILRKTFVIPISRTAFRGGSIRAAMERLDQGYLVGIFPEGTRSSGPPSRFRAGFLSLVRRSNVPVYPVAIWGADRVFPKGAWFVRPGEVRVVYGEPLTDSEMDYLKTGIRVPGGEVQAPDDEDQVAAFVQEKVLRLFQSADSLD